jgi:hypothetical protein
VFIRLNAKGGSVPSHRLLRRTAFTIIWLVWFGLLIAAVDTWGWWGFLVLIALPFAYWGMRRVDPESWQKEQERLERGDWWG